MIDYLDKVMDKANKGKFISFDQDVTGYRSIPTAWWYNDLENLNDDVIKFNPDSFEDTNFGFQGKVLKSTTVTLKRNKDKEYITHRQFSMIYF